MSPELEKALVEDYPDLFPDKDVYGFWGIECDDGWEPIVRKVCKTLNQKGYSYLPKNTGFIASTRNKRMLHNLCRKIEKLFRLPAYTLYKMKYPEYVRFKGYRVKLSQVKEKFGTLRIYHDLEPIFTEEEAAEIGKETIELEHRAFQSFIYGVLSYAEIESEETCEHDGKPGKLYPVGWHKVLCTDCAKASNKLKE